MRGAPEVEIEGAEVRVAFGKPASANAEFRDASEILSKAFFWAAASAKLMVVAT